MRKPDFSTLRVQVVGANAHLARTMRIVLGAAGVGQVVLVEDQRRALERLVTEHFDAVFVEGAGTDGTAFARVARRRALRNPLVPIFVVYGGPRRREVERARDLGATGVICRPVSPKTVADQLLSALLNPRPFISAPDFFGPDRRTGRPDSRAGERRKRIPRKAKIQLID